MNFRLSIVMSAVYVVTLLVPAPDTTRITVYDKGALIYGTEP